MRKGERLAGIRGKRRCVGVKTGEGGAVAGIASNEEMRGRFHTDIRVIPHLIQLVAAPIIR